jgi:hypothetical protein
MSAIPKVSFVFDQYKCQLARLTRSQVKDVLRASLQAGAWWWTTNYLMLRFTWYAGAKLGYALTSGHIKRKKDYNSPLPLVWTGTTRYSVAKTVAVREGGSSANPFVDVKYRVGGPRAPVVFRVLNTILQSEMGGVVRVIEATLADLLSGARKRGGRSLKMELPADSPKLMRQAHESSARGQIAPQAGDANDFKEDWAAHKNAAQQKVQRRLKLTHARWRRTAGGSAPVSGGGVSRTYAGSHRERYAMAQSRYRERNRQRRGHAA